MDGAEQILDCLARYLRSFLSDKKQKQMSVEDVRRWIVNVDTVLCRRWELRERVIMVKSDIVATFSVFKLAMDSHVGRTVKEDRLWTIFRAAQYVALSFVVGEKMYPMSVFCEKKLVKADKLRPAIIQVSLASSSTLMKFNCSDSHRAECERELMAR